MRRDSLNFRFTNPRPLLYFINHHVIAPIIPLDEFGIRLLPATFGVLAIPVLYLVTRRFLGARAALFATALLVVSPVHVVYSQFGRYWSLVFLFATVYPYALYLGVRSATDGRWRSASPPRCWRRWRILRRSSSWEGRRLCSPFTICGPTG